MAGLGEEEEKKKKNEIDKKGFITEDDASLLVQRYSPTTIITLLQEIAQISSPIIDWNAFAKRTATGISSGRECQMLWRHLAYRDSLLEKVKYEEEPLDDDSDLEFELEAFPLANAEALSEAESCVKVLMLSSLAREPGVTNRSTWPTPSVANVASEEPTHASVEKQELPRVNSSNSLTVPASALKRTSPTEISAEGLDGSKQAGPIYPPKKKRKIWTKEEDIELFAAVEKFGEGNWATIQRSGIMPERTASQLSQRWSFHQRKKGPGGSANRATSTTPLEERLATRKAINMALDDFRTGMFSARLSGASTQPVAQSSSMSLSAAKCNTVPVSAPQPVSQLPQVPAQAKLQKVTLNPSKNPRPTSKMQVATGKSSDEQKILLKAVALAAGGRVATPSTAANLLKAAQSKNAVHIGAGGDGKSKSSAANVKQMSTSYPAPQSAAAQSIRPAATINASPLANCVSLSTSLRHGGQHIQVFPRKLANSTALNSKVAMNQENLLVAGSGNASHENADKKTDNVDQATNGDVLSAEGVKVSKNMERNISAIQDHRIEIPGLDATVSDKNIPEKVQEAHASRYVEGGLSKTAPIEIQKLEGELVSLKPGAGKCKSVEIGADGNEITVGNTDERSKCPPVQCASSKLSETDKENLAANEITAD